MGYIRAKDIVVEFPIYGTGSRSLKKTFIRAATGGILEKDAADHVLVRALDKISFEAREGDRIGLMGHNGSGKTTLLRVIAGAYEPVSGSIEVRGQIASMLKITLGMDPEATGRENIFLRGTVMGLRKREIEHMIDDIAEFAELGDYLDIPMRTYSSGMAMRLAFGVATSVSADIVLMDEWMSVGDKDFAVKGQARLQRLVDKAKILVLASHDETLLKNNCSKILELSHGRLVPEHP